MSNFHEKVGCYSKLVFVTLVILIYFPPKTNYKALVCFLNRLNLHRSGLLCTG